MGKETSDVRKTSCVMAATNTHAKHFNELDKNGDGVLSKSEAVELLAQLDMFDEAQMASFWAGQAFVANQMSSR